VATTLTFEDGRRAYPHVVNWVLNHGQPRAARGLTTFDCAHVTVELTTPLNALPLHCGRKLNPAIGALEAAQLIGGFSDPELCVRIAPNFQRYREASGIFHGAYGRRIGRQLPAAISKIKNDPDTRQAIISLWDPWLDNQPGRLDYPCTVALRLSLDVDGRLDLDVLMRSNDVWLGTPYDWFQFTQLQLAAANALSAEPGVYRHTAWSLHLYRTDAHAASVVHPPTQLGGRSQPAGIGISGQDIETIMGVAASFHLGGDRAMYTDAERWYRELLRPPVVG